MEKLMFITRNMKAGGTERVISQLANKFTDSGTKCIIITLDESEVFYQIDDGVTIHAIGKKSSNIYLDKLLKYIDLRRYVNFSKPNVILALPEEIGIFVIPALMGTRVPVVVSERNNPWIMPWKKETRLMRKLVYPFSQGFVFQTKQAASFFSPGIRNKGVVLPNPLDLSNIPTPWKGEKRKEVVGAGRLEKQKNFPLLIRAFAKFYNSHPDYVLTIYGEGSQRSELVNIAASLLPRWVYKFPGRMKNYLECIRGASMFILSSDYEGMPNVLIEAMAMGIPVISTDCPPGGPAELIEDGISGLLVPVRDVDALSHAMCKVADFKEIGLLLGENALHVRERLDSTIVVRLWSHYLYEISHKKNAGAIVRKK